MIGKNGHKRKPRAALTLKQQRFCKAYAANGGNGTEAARTAGYKGSNNTLRVVASENLTKPNVRKYLATLTAAADRKIFRRLMPRKEALARVSFLASASLDMVLDNEGNFDINKARVTGGIHALKRVKQRTSTRHYKDGTVDETVTVEVELRDKNGSLELMGRHHNLWSGDIEDPDEVLSRLTGIPKHLLPTSLEPYISEELFESSDESDLSAVTLPRESTALPSHLTSDPNSEVNLNPETTRESDVPQGEMSPLERDGKLEDDDFNRQSSG